MATESSENFEESHEERSQLSNEDGRLSSANREFIQEYDETRMKNILLRVVYECGLTPVKFYFRLRLQKFPLCNPTFGSKG